MSDSTAVEYATLLEQARIAALKALTDILATSDDLKERRLAATAILRTPAPNPERSRPSSACRGFAAPSGNPTRAENARQRSEPKESAPPAAPRPRQWTHPLSGVMDREQLLRAVDSPAIRPHAIPFRRRRASSEVTTGPP